MGRRVYQVQQGDQIRWLKLQLKNSNENYQQSFLHELDIYSQLNQLEEADRNILCNFTVLTPYQNFQIEDDIIDQALWIENIAALFDQNPNQLGLTEVYLRLMMSLDVLGYLHDLGFVHGDLKREHFRYDQSAEQALLIDFEQTFHIDSISNIENSSSNDATPRYMAPELFHAEKKSFESDVYALGIIWLEWLTQHRLSAKSYQDWAILHCQQLNIELPEHFQHLFAVLNLMLKKNIASRCSNIYQIKQQLSQIV